MRPPLRLVLPAASALLALVLVLAILLGGSSKGSSSDSSRATISQPNTGFDGAALPAGSRAPAFTLPDQRGQSVSLSAYRGRVLVLVFLSSSCRSCVLVAQQVRGALDELAGPGSTPRGGSGSPVPAVRTLFVSTNPKADTHASVGRFLTETSLNGRVEYLTGDPAGLQPVWHAYGIAPASAGKAASQAPTAVSEAPTSVLLIDRYGNERVEFGLEQLTPESLAHDIRLLRAEA